GGDDDCGARQPRAHVRNWANDLDAGNAREPPHRSSRLPADEAKAQLRPRSMKLRPDGGGEPARRVDVRLIVERADECTGGLFGQWLRLEVVEIDAVGDGVNRAGRGELAIERSLGVA